jgi:hypothetical protein
LSAFRPRLLSPTADRSLEILNERVELVLFDLGHVPFAARRAVVARGRIVDAEEVMEDGPDVALTMTRLALADIQDDHASPLAAYLSRLHREGQPEAPAEVYPAYDRLERPGQPVRGELRSTWITLELAIYALVAGALADQGVDELAHRRRRDHVVIRHAVNR